MDAGSRGPKHGAGPVALMAAPLIVMLIAIGAVFLAGPQDGAPSPPPPPPPPPPLVGTAVPGFSLPPMEQGLDGLSDADLRGMVSVVSFWASWCLPCRAEMPLLIELAGRQDIAVHGINVRDRPVAARRFLTETGDPFRRIGVDADGRVSAALGVQGLPATLVVDAGGRIAYARTGPLQRSDMDDDILPLIRRLVPAP